MTFLFEQLDVYQRALGFADRVSGLTRPFPRHFWYIADQFNRASLSIVLNLAEGNGRGTPMDKRRFLFVARGSMLECVPLVDMCSRKKLLPQETCLELRGTLVDLSKMLARLIERMSPGDGVKEDGTDYI